MNVLNKVGFAKIRVIRVQKKTFRSGLTIFNYTPPKHAAETLGILKKQ